MAHVSTFPPTGQPGGWTGAFPVGTEAAFEVLSLDADKKRIGLAPVPEGSARSGRASLSDAEIVAGARLTGKVDRHEPFGVFVFPAPAAPA